MTWVNRNGDKPTIRADSLNVNLCRSNLNVTLQMHHTKSAPLSVFLWALSCFNHREVTECAGRPKASDCLQLLALQRGLRRGAGEQDGAGVWRRESRLNVEPLACQSGVATACSWSFPHGCWDTLMPLCWRCSSKLILLHIVTEWVS